MRVLFGMILGAALIVGTAFVSDSWSGDSDITTSGSSATTTVDHRNMVNWDVVAKNVRSASHRAREAWSALSRKVTG
jgi:hypothetical protein